MRQFPIAESIVIYRAKCLLPAMNCVTGFPLWNFFFNPSRNPVKWKLAFPFCRGGADFEGPEIHNGTSILKKVPLF